MHDVDSALDNKPTRHNLGPFYVDYHSQEFFKRLVLNVKSYVERHEIEAQ